jgi:hypothetical protein
MKGDGYQSLACSVSLSATCFHAGFFLCIFFDPEDVGDMFL